MAEQKQTSKKTGLALAIPFFAVLALLSVISFIIPLRPAVSYSEKRELAKFPAFSLSALTDGSYFRDISTWYSDTFPGRESWLDASQRIAAFHGYGSIAIEGSLAEQPDDIPDVPAPTKPVILQEPETEPEETEAVPEETAEDISETAEETEAVEETEASEESVNADGTLPDAVFSKTSIVQIGGSAYQPLGFSQPQSDRYVNIVSAFANKASKSGVKVVSAPPPIAIGVEVDPEYLPKLRSSDQGATLNYIHGSMTDNVITVDTQSALLPHRGEYLFFHSDHHWTALAAYYCYRATCEALNLEPAALEDFTEMNQGEFAGTLYGRARYPLKLEKDYVYSYAPPGDIEMRVFTAKAGEYDGKVIRDMSKAKKKGSKYLCFLEGDQPLVRITNHDVPESTGTCLILKDSFGNCFVPYFTQNFHTVYGMDYRKYSKTTLKRFVEAHNVDVVIFAPNMMSTQSRIGLDCLSGLCGFTY